MNLQCVSCKGRNICGRSFCPIKAKINVQTKVNLEAKQDFQGKSPNIFIGKFGYPDINVGILSTENFKNHDNPNLWSHENYKIDKVINLRTELVNSQFKTNVKGFNDKLLDLSKEISLSKKEVDVEINLSKKPKFNLNFNQDVMPHGPNVEIKKAQITENVKVPIHVEKAVGDSDRTATESIKYLYRHGIDEHYLTKLFSVGNFGIKTERKLVPTRWSITAVDDIVGKNLIIKIQDSRECDFAAYVGSHLGNYYIVLTFPGVWSYELFETYVGNSDNQTQFNQLTVTKTFSTDYENHEGRSNYANNTAGGYYAARLAILEHLNEKKQRGNILALRFITDEYWAPLGVWVCREATRKAMNSKPIIFSDQELMLKWAEVYIKKKFNYDIRLVTGHSKLLKERKSQKKLNDFG